MKRPDYPDMVAGLKPFLHQMKMYHVEFNNDTSVASTAPTTAISTLTMTEPGAQRRGLGCLVQDAACKYSIIDIASESIHRLRRWKWGGAREHIWRRSFPRFMRNSTNLWCHLWKSYPGSKDSDDACKNVNVDVISLKTRRSDSYMSCLFLTWAYFTLATFYLNRLTSGGCLVTNS